MFPQHPIHLRYRRRGVALVIVLAFVVLLTGLVVAFFSRAMIERGISNSSANQTKAELLAEGAAAVIIGDLKQEIAAGSVQPFPTPATGVTIYAPKAAAAPSPATVTPFLVGSTGTGGLENLVKRSVNGTGFYPSGSSYDTTNFPPSNRAASINTIVASQNGRSISPARWNKPLLLQKATPTSDTDFTPVGAVAATGTAPATWSNAPDWILVDRDGSNPTTWNTNMVTSAKNTTSVIGRYAYNIYDEGGLLDVNAAGYPAALGALTPTKTGYKGALAFADLKQLPSISALSSTWQDNVIDGLTGWRNYASASNPAPVLGGTFPSYTWTASNATNYYNSILANPTGFLTTASHTVIGGQTDRMFSSRKELIDLLTQGIAPGGASNVANRANIQNSLQYLGTFSRDLEQPSFVPDPNRPKVRQLAVAPSVVPVNENDAYASDQARDANQVTDINPSVLRVRNTDGTPVMKRRFPLSRLQYVSTPTPGAASVANAQKIYDYFGLVWDSANNRWVYEHPANATTVPATAPTSTGVINKLSDLKDLREPDFFEVLKAAIHVGSLGKQFGNPLSSLSTSVHALGNDDGVTTYQIIQIGADIIDQYDSDSYPTRILFDSAGKREFYGIEDLPYLYRSRMFSYKVRSMNPQMKAPNNLYSDLYVMMLQPELWNPHAPPPASGAPTAGPTIFDVAAKSSTGCYMEATTLGGSPAWSSSTSDDPGFYYDFTNKGPTVTGPKFISGANAITYSDDPSSTNYASLSFKVASSAADPFREPLALKIPGYPSAINFTSAPNNPDFDSDTSVAGQAKPDTLVAVIYNSPVDESSLETSVPAPPVPPNVTGFRLGYFCNGPRNGGAGAGASEWLRQFKYVGERIGLELQYKDASGNPWTYDVIDDAVVSNSQDNSHRLWGSRWDPRSDRWGLGFEVGTGTYPPTQTQRPSYTVHTRFNDNLTGGSNAQRPSAPGWTSQWNIQGYTDDNLGAYSDPDNIRRYSMGRYVIDPTDADVGRPMTTGNYPSRPVVLNRPFRSVAELGFAFRGVAWRNLDFFTQESGDAALLDYFCMNELSSGTTSQLVAGRINLNTRQAPVLQALLSGVSKDESNVLSATDTSNIANALVTWTTSTNGPLVNRSELVGKYTSSTTAPYPGAYTGFSTQLTSLLANQIDQKTQRRRECVMRALTDSGNTRTWNLLIDVVAQSGRYPATAASAANPLAAFVVEGEKRYWVHVAIDRFTGQVVDKLVEPVTE